MVSVTAGWTSVVVGETVSVGIKVPVSSVEKICSVVDWKLGVVMQTSTGTPSCKTISQFGLEVIKVKLSANNGSGVVIKSVVILKGLRLVTGSEIVVITVVESSVVAIVAGIAVVLLWAVEMMGGRVEIVVELLGVVVVVLAVVVVDEGVEVVVLAVEEVGGRVEVVVRLGVVVVCWVVVVVGSVEVVAGLGVVVVG